MSVLYRPIHFQAAIRSCLPGLLLLALLAGPAWGQARPRAAAQPKQIDPKIAAANEAADLKREQTRLRFKVNQARGDGKVDSTEQESVDQFYGMFAQLMALPGLNAELPALRESIKRETRTWGMAEDKSGLAVVNGVLLARMQELAFDNQQTALARFNALLVIGDLNAVETNLVGAGDPKQMPEATPVLLTALSDPGVIDALKVAALVGLARHASIGIEDKQVEKQIITELQKLAAQSEIPDERGADGHNWLRRSAIEVLLTLVAKPGMPSNQELATTLEQIVADSELPLAFRIEAAEALGQVGVAQGTIVNALGETTLEITKAELNPAAYRYYLRAVQRCLTGEDAKSGITPKLPLTEKKLAQELTDLLNGINTRMDRVGNNPQGIRNQMVLETKRVEDWLATFNEPDDTETEESDTTKPADAEPTEPKVQANANAPAEPAANAAEPAADPAAAADAKSGN